MARWYFVLINKMFLLLQTGSGEDTIRVVGTEDGSLTLDEAACEAVMRDGAAAFAQWEAAAAAEKLTAVTTVALLADNPAAVREAAVALLLRLLTNVTREPDSAKYRVLRLTNPRVSAQLLGARGGVETLLAAGFVARGAEEVELPSTASLARVGAVVAALQELGSDNAFIGLKSR